MLVDFKRTKTSLGETNKQDNTFYLKGLTPKFH